MNAKREREEMINVLRRYAIEDKTVLAAMSKIHRHVYIPEEFRNIRDAYGDHPCPIGHDQTISQPFIVAYMTERMQVKPGMRILEIGTGSGYQAAVLAELGVTVYSIEIVPDLADHARQVLAKEGYGNVKVKTGDGYKGWPEYAPFDAIIVTCAPNEIPNALVEQLKNGGRMIIPVGTGVQRLIILLKKGGSLEEIFDRHVRFVPMVEGED